MTFGFKPILLVIVVAGLATGCGKRDLNLSVKAADVERDQPTAALVRKIDLTYSSPGGKEEMRQSIPVLGLSQPVSARADLLKELKVEEGGTFEARGYTSEGILMLRGLAQAHDESEAIEITMGRDGNPPELMGKPLLRRVRLANVPSASSFEREAKDLMSSAGSENPSVPGSETCTELPSLKITPSGAGSYPKLILEGAIKAPNFKIEVGVRLEKGLFKALEAARMLPINPNGDAELELGRQFLDGALLKHAWKLMLRLHSSHYEGCFEISTHPEFNPPEVNDHLAGGWGRSTNRFNNDPAGYIRVSNPNTVPMRVELAGGVTQTGSGAVVWPCYELNTDARLLELVRCKDHIVASVVVAPGGSQNIGIFGALPQRGSSYYDMLTRGLQIRWLINAEVFAEDGSRLEAGLPAQSHLTEIP